jgi:hypothetical protein
VSQVSQATVSQATGQPGRHASARNMDSPIAIIGDDAGEEFA